MHVQNLMNSLWDIRILLGLVPKESHCISLQAILQTEHVLRANFYEGAGTYIPVTVLSMNTYPDNETFHSPSRVQYFAKVMPVIQNRGFQTRTTRVSLREDHWPLEWHITFLMFVNPCIIVYFILKIQQDATVYKNFISYLYEARHVLGATPPIIRSLKLH